MSCTAMLHKTNLWQLLTKTCIHQSSIKSVSGYLAQVVLLRDGCFQPLCHSNIPKQGCCCVESIFTCINTLYVTYYSFTGRVQHLLLLNHHLCRHPLHRQGHLLLTEKIPVHWKKKRGLLAYSVPL